MKLTDETNVAWLAGDHDAPARVGQSQTGDLVIEWFDLARLTVSPRTGERKFEPVAELDEAVVRKLERGLARAIAEYLRGAMVFHAAAVSWAGRGLLILGGAGAGKSTTAALLCARGAALLADDCAVGVVEGGRFMLEPMEDRHWLDPPAREALRLGGESDGKEPVVATKLAERPAPTRSVVLLDVDEDRDSDVIVTQCRGLEAARGLLDAMLRLPLGEAQSKADFERMAAVASLVTVYKVLRPARFTATLSDKLTSALLDLAK